MLPTPLRSSSVTAVSEPFIVQIPPCPLSSLEARRGRRAVRPRCPSTPWPRGTGVASRARGHPLRRPSSLAMTARSPLASAAGRRSLGAGFGPAFHGKPGGPSATRQLRAPDGGTAADPPTSHGTCAFMYDTCLTIGREVANVTRGTGGRGRGTSRALAPSAEISTPATGVPEPAGENAPRRVFLGKATPRGYGGRPRLSPDAAAAFAAVVDPARARAAVEGRTLVYTVRWG